MRVRMWLLGVLIISVVFGTIAGQVFGGGTGSSHQSNEEESVKTLVEFFADSNISLLEHPDTLQVYFPDSIAEHDRELITMAIEISQPLFSEMGIPFTMNVYVADTKNAYIDLYQKIFNATAQDALEGYSSARAATDPYNGNVLINIALNDEIYSTEKRDGAIVFATLHEFYHIAQTKLSEGFITLMNDPLLETSANLGARRILFNSFCLSWQEFVNIQELVRTPDCDPDFVKEQIFDYLAINYFSNYEKTSSSAFYATGLYIVGNYGLNGYDDFYGTLATLAKEMPAGDDPEKTPQNQLWPDALQSTFGVRSLEELAQNALTYAADNREQIISDLREKYPELFVE